MTALIRTILRRYFRSKLCLMFLAMSLAAGVISGKFCYQQIQKELYFNTEVFIYAFAAVLFLICAGIVMIIGSAFSDGVIRLQCIHGNAKDKIALAHLLGALIWSAVCGILLLSAFCFFSRDWLTKFLTGKMMQLIPPLLMMFPVWGITIAAITLAVRNRAFSAVLGIAALLGLLIWGMNTEFALDEPKYREDYVSNNVYNDDGTHTLENQKKLVPNEWYIPKPERDYKEFCYLLDPLTPLPEEGWYLANVRDNFTGADQFNKEMQSFHRARRKFLPLFQTVTILILSAVSTAVFKRRNLK